MIGSPRDKHQRTWSFSEKLEALQVLKREGVGQASRQLGVSTTTLYKWRDSFEAQGEQGLARKQGQRKDPELERLKREYRELKMLVAEKDRTADAVGHPYSERSAKKKPLERSLRMAVAQDCIGAGMSKNLVLGICRISRSSFYYKARSGRAGRPCPGVTITRKGLWVNDSKVIQDIIELLAGEFVDYGHYKTMVHLRDEKGYVINHKKVYRLMRENKLLVLNRQTFNAVKRQWVKELVPDPKAEFCYLEFDRAADRIKYIYVQGKQTNAQVLTVLDVFSRWNMGQVVKWNIRQGDVVALFDTIFENCRLPKRFYVRNDNGSQFVADSVQQYFRDKKITQEFTKPATPQQNAHIESYRAAFRHSVMERAVCKRHELDSLEQACQTLDRFREFYNHRRIHSGVGYTSPYKFLLKRGVDMKKQHPETENIPTNYLEILS